MNQCESIDTTRNVRALAMFWFPLAAMWLFMGLEMPIINAFIARLPDAKENLAAFGVVFSLGIVVESPIIQLLTTGTALATDKKNYRRLMRFMHTLGIGLTAIHLLIALTPLFDIILGRIMGIPESIIGIGRGPFLLFFPFHAAVGYRRLWQGVLIKYGRTKEVTYTMIVRFCATTGILFIGYFFTGMSGALLGSAALTGGVISGALAARILVQRACLRMEEDRKDTSLISWSDLVRFYIPLALTSFIIVGVRPVLAAGIARGNMPLESLAVWPVIHGFVFLFRSVSLSFQEVVVAKMDEPGTKPLLRRFAFYVAAGIAGIYILTAASPLSDIWFEYLAGLKEDLLPLTGLPFLIAAPVPILSAFISYYRGLLVHDRSTKTIALAVSINSALVIIALFLGVSFLPVNGAIVAAGALSLSVIVETLFLRYKIRHGEKQEC